MGCCEQHDCAYSHSVLGCGCTYISVGSNLQVELLSPLTGSNKCCLTVSKGVMWPVEIGFFHGVIVSCEVLRKAFRDPCIGGHEQSWSGATEQRRGQSPGATPGVTSRPGGSAPSCWRSPASGPQAHTRAYQAQEGQDPERHNFSVSIPPPAHPSPSGPDAATERVNEQREGRAGGQRNLC